MRKACFNILGCILLLASVFSLSGCKSSVPAGTSLSSSQERQPILPAGSVEELMIVDCLLPGKIRKLGRRMTYVTPRTAFKTSAVDCEIRGGEYVAYDRANYATALRVWQTQAEQGDAAAQTYVGEIYEKGLGTAPNYLVAAEWYRKAAEQGYSRAQMNLAYMYEQGLGVTKDLTSAYSWFRKASGLKEGALPDHAAGSRSESEEMKSLREELQRNKQEIEVIREKLREAEGRIGTYRDTESEVQQMRSRIVALTDRVKQLQKKNTESGTVRMDLPLINYGRYYALIIGNNKHTYLEDLETAVYDAQEVDRVLSGKYGFRTKLITDADQLEIISALFDFQQNLTKDDNFLLYYAGHGEYDSLNKRGHWLPVDAQEKNPARWISNEKISDMLNAIQARHILVVADSCYSGTMTSLSIPRLTSGMSKDILIYSVQTMAKKRSRTVLTSGGLEPVSDAGGGGHSVFAGVLLDLLEKNAQILTGKDLHDYVSPQVSLKSVDALGKKQEPVYAAFQYAGHEGGDFFFVPANTAAGGSITAQDIIASR